MLKTRAVRWGALGITSLVLALGATSLPAHAGTAASGSGGDPPASPSQFTGRSTIPHLSSRLAALAENSTGSLVAQAKATDTAASGTDSLQRRGSTDKVLVNIRVAHYDDAALARLSAAGATITHRSPAYRTVTAAVGPSDLRAIAAVAGVQYVADIQTPQTGEVCDATISEGDQILKAIDERTNSGSDGSGVTVGIISDSFDTDTTAVTRAADDVVSDNLPGTANTCGHTTPVGVVQDGSSSDTDEGRAMAQIVHDLAPGAKIMFATSNGGDAAFAANIRALAARGANIIADDIIYYDEPMYQDGVIANAVNDVRAEGIDYFSMAFNNNISIGGKDVGSYEAVDGYRPTDCPAAITAYNADYTDCHNFSATGDDPTYGFTMAPSASVVLVLDWAEPEYGVKTDYAICIMGGATLLGCVDDRNPGPNGSQVPEEGLELTAGSGGGGYSVIIPRYSGDDPNTNGTPRFKLVFATDGNGAVTGFEYNTPSGDDVIGPTIFGHNGTEGAETVAASDVRVTPSAVDSYSSHGPETLLFGPVDGTTPAAALPAPKVLNKPNLTASDCAINTFFGFYDGTNYRFCGTSAATPHAAAVAALLLAQNPLLTPDQINNALESTASDLGVPALVQGAGLVNAAAAGAAVVPKSQTISFAQPAPGAVRGTTTLAATATSGLPVTFSVSPTSSTPAGVCTVSGSHGVTVHYKKAGRCVIDADQAGNALFHPALQVARTITVKAAPTVTTKALPAGTVGKKYTAKLTTTGGSLPITWALKTGKLPSGLKLAKTGAITGMPKKAGHYGLTVVASDSSRPKATATKTLTIKVTPIAVRTDSLHKGKVGKRYAATLHAYGGIKPLKWSVAKGKLPKGLTLTKSGKITGKPAKAGIYRITVKVSDTKRHKATEKLILRVRK